MRSEKTIWAAKTAYIALSALLCALGLLLILKPAISLGLTGTIVGGVMIAFGAVKLMGYFSKDLYQLAFQFDLAFGILLIALGVLILVRPVRAMAMLCVILGIEIIADGLFKVQMALDARRFGLLSWWLILAMAVLTGAAGVAIALHPSESALTLTAMTGAALTAQGLMNLCVALCAVKVTACRRPDIVEVRFAEGRDR
ncbi:MAG: DUF308 domain-containing protein [Clostridia bacterium]|nr:DUF308 domain-containing protein [Clostridia bacterium]